MSHSNLAVLKYLLLSAIVCMHTSVFSQCADCGSRGLFDSAFPPDEASARQYRNRIVSKMNETGLDNGIDSTTQRVEALDNSLFDKLDVSVKKFYEKELFQVFVDLAHNDPYPSVRLEALHQISKFSTIPAEERYKALEQGLHDQSTFVRVQTALTILSRHRYDGVKLNKLALKIARDAATGKDRSGWNVKGFYTQAQFDQDAAVIDSLRDQIQRFGMMGLDSYGISSIDLLDSLSQHGSGKEVRESAKHGLFLR